MNWLKSKPILALAPMADMTDSPFCRVCREVSGQDFVIFREMISAEAVVRNSAKTLAMCRFEDMERPIVIQIFGSNPGVMAEAARIIVDKFHPDGIDVNMGCPVPKITGKSLAGAALMKSPEKAVEIVRALKAEKLGVPISVKTRLGWSKEDEILELAPKLEEAGIDLLSIHGRTKIQGYKGKASWEMITKVKKILSIPVLANGDINSENDIKKCLEITRADGVMIGRGALGNPWIFKAKDRGSVDLKEVIKVVLRHLDWHLERYGEGSVVTFRKHLAWYFKNIPNIKETRKKLLLVSSKEELSGLLHGLL